MRTQRWIAQSILNVIEPHPASFAFAPRRNLIDAARRHAGCRWLVKLDLRNFFEAISEQRVYHVFKELGYGDLISFELARLCTHGPLSQDISSEIAASALPHAPEPPGFLPQGAPSSPMLANLAVHRLDHRLQTMADSKGWIYTRYADDLAFSTTAPTTREQARALAREVDREVRRFGLVCNKSKTTVVPPGARKGP